MRAFKSKWFISQIYPKIEDIISHDPSYVKRISGYNALYVRGIISFDNI